MLVSLSLSLVPVSGAIVLVLHWRCFCTYLVHQHFSETSPNFSSAVGPAVKQVAAREGLVASIEVSAGEALGSGATARAFGSYGGARTEEAQAGEMFTCCSFLAGIYHVFTSER